MLPNTGRLLRQGFERKPQPSKTYRLEEGRIRGTVDGLEAVRQAALCILNTERFEHVIYSWNYGVELKGLGGTPMRLAEAKAKKRIREALTQDARILRVDGFSFARDGKKLHAQFTVHTAQGSFEAEKEVGL